MARTTGSDGERTAGAIRAAALRLIARHGYAAVSMRAIAADVGVQAGALYAYFPTKQSILRALMVEHLTELLDAWDAARPAGARPEAELDAFARFHIHHHLDRPDAVFISYMELRSLEPDAFAEVEALRHAYERRLRDILDRGALAGAFDIADAPVQAMAIIAMLTGVNTWYRSGGRLSPERIESIYAGMVARSVGARARHAPDDAATEDTCSTRP